MAFNVGVNVLEVDGRAAPTVAAAPVSVAGFLVTSERGIPDTPTQVRGTVDLANNFGAITATTALGNLAVRGFFDNGGSEAYVVRVAGAATPARVTLRDRAAAPIDTLRVTAGSRGREDPGSWGNSVSVIIEDHPRASSPIPAQMIGTAAEPYNLAGASLQITVNGAPAPITITFAVTDFANIAAASAAEVAAAINRQTTQIRAAATPNQRVVIASAVPGTSSRLAVAAGAGATALGFGATSSDTVAASTLLAIHSTAGLLPGTAALPGSAVRLETPAHIVAATPMVGPVNLGAPGSRPALHVILNGGTPVLVEFAASDFTSASLASALSGEIVASITRQGGGRFVAGLTHDSRLVIRATREYGSGTISVDAPTAPGTTSGLTAIGLTGAAPIAGVAGVRDYHQVDAVSQPSGTVTFVPLVLPAVAASLPVIVVRLQSVEFDLTVRRGLSEERFESVTMQNALPYFVEAVVNDEASGSRFITVSKLATLTGAGANAPAERRDATGRLIATMLGVANDGATPTFTAGTDATPGDIDFIGDAAARTGLRAFDPVRIQLLACPDTQSPGVTLAALAYCEQRGDAMFVGTTPRGYDLDGAKTYAAPFRARKVFGALYWPWIDVVNPLDTTGNRPRMTIPPVGHVLGTYARIADTRGVWKAPAGDEALVRSALAVERDITDVEHTDLVKNGSVNAIRAIPGSGIIIDSSRTLSTDTRWLFVGTRRLFNFVKLSLKDGLRWVAQEPHSDALRRAVRFNVITPFLLGLWRQGAFGTDAPDEVFTVICDATNNPPADVNLGNFKVEVYFYPVKPAETIIIVVGQQESGASAAEA